MPKYNNPRKTWRYADEFKIRAVEMSHQEGVKSGILPSDWSARLVSQSGVVLKKRQFMARAMRSGPQRGSPSGWHYALAPATTKADALAVGADRADHRYD